ncbi:MAG: ABC transporter, partial [Lachnospiraceae bacterium]|nr:ABC transporter [Lachnospiraceae bacterium]
MKKKILTLLLAGTVLTTALTGCGASGNNSTGAETGTGSEAAAPSGDTASTVKAYKVGIVQYVDDASLNQIVAAVQA